MPKRGAARLSPRSKLLEMLSKGPATVVDLARGLRLPEVEVRRLIGTIANDGRARYCHGGEAVYACRTYDGIGKYMSFAAIDGGRREPRLEPIRARRVGSSPVAFHNVSGGDAA